MTKDEMKSDYIAFITKVSEILGLGKPVDILTLCSTTDLFFKPLEKRIAELEKEISVLLSCKNCPENKGGYICQKEYENKCLAQKIQYIKELQQENAELLCQKNRNKSCYSCANATERCFRNEIGCPCQKYKSYKEENAELKKKAENLQKYLDTQNCYRECAETWLKLTEAKELLTKWVELFKPKGGNMPPTPIQVATEQFLNSEVEK